MKIRILLFGIIGFISMSLHQAVAAPAVPWLVEKQQPDGSKISVYIRGDEKVHWMESPDGYTLMYNSKKDIVYADLDSDGNMIPSRVIYSQTSKQSSGLFKKGLRYSPSQVAMLKKIWKISEPKKLRSAQQQASVTGAKKALCVLMDFPDKTFSQTQEQFENLMNQVGYSAGTAKGSVKDFYRENSYNQMDLTVSVVGPYRADYNLLYYTESNFPNDEGYLYFAQEAIEKANADPNVNLNDFANANNELETFHIIYAGYGDEAIGNGQQIWAHKWQLASPLTLNGVKVSVYSCSPELRNSSGNTITAIGVICHELCHVFGSPDYYDIDYSGFDGSGKWDLMANGSWNGNGDTPAHINVFQKTLYGWVNPIELTSYTEVENMPNSAENPVAYSINANTTGEMYLMENRQQVKFDVGVPGHGLLIWHIHKNASTEFAPNNTHPQQVYPVVASSSVAIPTGSVSSYGSINSTGTPFPGTSGKTNFTNISVPQAFTWDGLNGIEKPVTNISETNNKISFIFMEAAPDPVTGFQANIEDENTVVLTWTAAEDEAVVGYKIFRDNVLQTTINGRMLTTYSQTNVPNKTYEYCIVAMNNIVASSKACTSVVVAADLAPVTNFQATVTDGNKVTLTWTPSASVKTSGYKIYRDDVLQYTISGRTVDTYTQFNVPNGTYEYGIMAFDAVLESEKVYATAAVTESTDAYCVSVSNLNAYSTADKVLLKWDSPFGGWSSIAGNYAWGISLTNTAILGRKWSTSELKGMSGFLISKVKFVPREDETHKADYTVVVYSIPQAGTPELVYQQPIVQPLSSQSLNEILLNTPVEIDASKEWIVGIRYEPIGGQAYFTTDGIGSNDPRNVFYDATNGWRTLQSQIGLGYNYCLQVYFDVANAPFSAAPALRATPFIGYNIYRDGELLTTVNNRTNEYIDESLVLNTTYSYCVSIKYGDCVSEPVCVEATTCEPPTVDPEQYCFPVTNVIASATEESVHLKWNDPQRAGWFTISGNTHIYTMTNLSNPFEIGVLWRPEDLQGLHGFRLTKVKFAPYNNKNTESQLSIVAYKTNEFGISELVYCQPLEYSPYIDSAGKEFVLNTPIEIDASKNWIIGVRYEEISTFVTDNSSDNNPRNLIRYVGDDWYAMGAFFNNFERNFYFEMYLDGNEPSAAPVVLNNKRNQPSFWEQVQTRMPKKRENITSSTLISYPAEQIQRAAANITGYTIYRNGQFLTTAPAGSLNYTDNTAEPNTAYTYCVSANYSSGCSSEPVCVEITTKAISHAYIPVENLQIYDGILLKDKQIKWEQPGGMLQYCGSIASYIVSSGNTSFAIRIPKEELKDKSGSLLTKISYYCTYGVNPATANAFLCVWKGKSETQTDMLVYEQAIPADAFYFTQGWHELSLTAPVDVYDDDDLWIGMRVGEMQAISDAQPNVRNSSKLYNKYSDSWYSASYNILIKGYLEPKENIVSYSVFKDDEPLVSVDANTFSYLDRDLPTGSYKYCVTAVYDTGESEEKCLETIVEADRYNPVSNLHAALSAIEKNVELTWEAPNTAQKTLRYCSESIFSWSPFEEVTYAVCFPVEELSAMHGFYLRRINFLSGGSSGDMDIDLCVWRGKNSNNEPDKLVYEQNVSNFVTYWNYIQLNEPVEIDANKELWIGVRVHSKTPGVEYNLYLDNSSNAPTGRNMRYSAASGWYSTSRNYFLSGEISPKADLESYTISRSTTLSMSPVLRSTVWPVILDNNILNYTDINPVNGLHEYGITANYSTGDSPTVYESIQIGNLPTESEQSREKDIYVYCKNQIIYAVSTESDPIRRIEIYNLQGKRIYLNDRVNAATYTIRNNISLPEVCIVRLITETKTKNTTIIKCDN